MSHPQPPKVEDYRKVKLSSVRPSPVALRAVDREDPDYLNLVASVGRNGVLQAIEVREKIDSESNEVYFELTDGLHRFSAATDNGLDFITVLVKNKTDAEVEETQLVANLCKVDTKPGDQTKHLMRMLARNPTMTTGDLAEMISQSISYVTGRLSLLKLEPSILDLVNAGDISITNAIALSKLPRDEQHLFSDAAITDTPDLFCPTVQKRATELKAAAAAGRKANPPQFSPTAHVRKLPELMAEIANGSIGFATVTSLKLQTATEGFAAAIKYAAMLDEQTVTAAHVKWDQGQKERADAAARGKAERAEKTRREAAAKAEKARVDAGLSEEEINAALVEENEEAVA